MVRGYKYRGEHDLNRKNDHISGDVYGFGRLIINETPQIKYSLTEFYILKRNTSA
jgi:hypothetical protein